MPCMPRVDSLRDELSKVKEGRNGENGAAELQIGSGIWKWHAACPIHARDPPPTYNFKSNDDDRGYKYGFTRERPCLARLLAFRVA